MRFAVTEFGSVRQTLKVRKFHCMMHSSDEDIELCSVDRFGSIEPDSLQKNKKIIKKLGKYQVRFAATKSNYFDWVRFENLFKFDSFTLVI